MVTTELDLKLIVLTDIKYDYITVGEPNIIVDFTVLGDEHHPLNIPIAFINATQNAESPVYSWSFGDEFTSNLKDPTHVYTSPGTYQVTLSVVDAHNRSGSKTKEVIVNPPSPIADFTVDYDHGIGPLTVTFTNTSQNAEEYVWDFGDFDHSSDEDPIHTFTTTGKYIVSLTARNATFEEDTISRTITVNSELCADFEMSAPSWISPSQVTFINKSVSRGAPFQSFWTFGDGGYSDLKDPLHTYNAPGTYEVSLGVTNGNEVDSIYKLVVIVPAEPDKPKEYSGPNHSFWIEFLESPIFPFSLERAIEGINKIKPAGTCFKGFIFNAEKVRVESSVAVNAYYSYDHAENPVTVGAQNCINKRNASMKWGTDPWGKSRYGYLESEVCDNTCWFLLLHIGFGSQIIRAFADSVITDWDYLINHEIYHEIPPMDECFADYYPSSLPPSMRAGGVFCKYWGYGDGGYDNHVYDCSQREYFNTMWIDALIHTGLGNPRLRPYTDAELSGVDKNTKYQMESLSQLGWVSGNGMYHEIRWGEDAFGDFPWGFDLAVKEHENECHIYLIVNMYCPVTYVTTDLPAVHIRCPKDAKYRDVRQIEMDCIYTVDDSVEIFTPDTSRDAGLSVESEWITF